MAPPKKAIERQCSLRESGSRGAWRSCPGLLISPAPDVGEEGRWLGREQALWGWGEVGWERSEGGRGLPARPGEGSGRRGARGMLS